MGEGVSTSRMFRSRLSLRESRSFQRASSRARRWRSSSSCCCLARRNRSSSSRRNLQETNSFHYIKYGNNNKHSAPVVFLLSLAPPSFFLLLQRSLSLLHFSKLLLTQTLLFRLAPVKNTKQVNDLRKMFVQCKPLKSPAQLVQSRLLLASQSRVAAVVAVVVAMATASVRTCRDTF